MILRKLVAILTAFAAAGAVALLGSAPAEAAGAIQFRKFYYDSAGTDSGSNASLNREWFVLKNVTSTRRNLYGFTVRDEANHVYRFASNFYLRPGYTVKIHTGKGTNGTYHRYWGRSWYVWNNTGDTATLRNKAGTKVDTCAWSSRGAGYKIC